jgi:acetyl esterase/lipase
MTMSKSSQIAGFILLIAVGVYLLLTQGHRRTSPEECVRKESTVDTPTPPARCTPILYANVAYAHPSDPRQVLDVYQPASVPGPYPTLFMVHGGGFLAGAKDDLAPLARWFAQQGYAVVLVEYRLAPEHVYPAQVQDAFCALGWLYAHAATYAFNSDQIVAVGESVGGSLVALLGAVEDPQRYLEDCAYDVPDGERLHGVVAFYPVTNFALPAYGAFFVPYLGLPPEQAPERWAEASPLQWIDGEEPPFLVLHGSWDVRVPSSESRNLVEALRAQQSEAELVVIQQADHGFLAETLESRHSRAALEAMEAFFEKLELRPH